MVIPADVAIPGGTVLNRYGSSAGEILYLGNPLFVFLSIPQWAEALPKKSFKVKVDFVATQGRACPWYGLPGGAKIIDLGIGRSANDLLAAGILEEIQA